MARSMLLLALLPAALGFGTQIFNGKTPVLPNYRGESMLTSPLPSTYITREEIPRNFSWRQFGLVTPVLNQQMPQDCGCCWAFAGTSSLQDRIAIARAAQGDIAGPTVMGSIQALLNCGADTAGSCSSGSIGGAYQWIYDVGGMPYDSCQPYTAVPQSDWSGDQCPAQLMCAATWEYNASTSKGPFRQPIPYNSLGLQTYEGSMINATFASTGYPVIKVAEYGNVSGTWTPQGKDVFDMQAEILARGPIGCAIAPAAIFNYSSGIVRWPSSCCLNITYDVVGDNGTVTSNETTNSCNHSLAAPNSNCSLHHAIAIVGWGEDDGVQYWEVRNSWGNFWGEDGFMRVEMGKNVIGIETDCSFAVPEGWGKVPITPAPPTWMPTVQMSTGYKDHMRVYDQATVTSFWKQLTAGTWNRFGITVLSTEMDAARVREGDDGARSGNAWVLPAVCGLLLVVVGSSLYAVRVGVHRRAGSTEQPSRELGSHEPVPSDPESQERCLKSQEH